jgi:hypothetical protein
MSETEIKEDILKVLLDDIVYIKSELCTTNKKILMLEQDNKKLLDGQTKLQDTQSFCKQKIIKIENYMNETIEKKKEQIERKKDDEKRGRRLERDRIKQEDRKRDHS